MKPGQMTPWEMTYDHFDPADEPTREALCTLGNGYICTRGAIETQSAGGAHYPGTYLACGYNRAASNIAGETIENEDLVNWPNWMFLAFRIDDGAWFDIGRTTLLEYRQQLDVRRGLLLRTIRFQDDQGRITRWHSRRLVSMAQFHYAAIEWTMVPENWSGRLEIRSALDGQVANTGVGRYRDLTSQHLTAVEWLPVGPESVLLVVDTLQSHIRMAQAARTRLFCRGQHLSPERVVCQRLGFIGHEIRLPVEQGVELRLEKVVAIYSSRDNAISSPASEARKEIARAGTFAELLADHELAWRQLWHRCDMQLPDANDAHFIVRLHAFHLLQTASPNSIDYDVGIPSRGWHGEAYRGHVFWDELFVFPFLILRMPELARSLLMYRYRRLREARCAAAAAGYAGAMYPWQSGSDGREESQVIHLNPKTGQWVPDSTYLQRHISSAVAFNVWKYYQVTGDLHFLSFYGAEMILEIARFWASIAVYNDQRDRYEIRGVVGPDEFHTHYPDSDTPGLDNNAYTNVLAAWVLQRAGEVLRLLPRDRSEELKERLAISDQTLARFDEVSRKLFVPFHDDGIISQFEGYEKLAEFDWSGYRAKYGDVHRLDRILPLEGDTPNRYKASKQADALMLFYLFSAEELEQIFAHLGYQFDPELIPRNIDYYIDRTSHGSTLSHMVHAWVLARSDRKRSWGMFCDTLTADVLDIQGGTTSEGIHLGAMAGTLDLAQRCYTGLEIRQDVLRLNPRLPRELDRLKLRIQYRGHWLALNINHEQMEVAFDSGIRPPVQVAYEDDVQDFGPGDRKVFKLKSPSP